jgi:hypothetical protein
VAERGADFGDSNFFTTALNPKKAIAVLACVEAHAASALKLLGSDTVLASLPKFELLHRYLAAAASVVSNERSIGNADYIDLQANAATTTAPYEQQLAKFVNLAVRDVFDAGGMPLLAGLAAASGPTGRTADRASNSKYQKMLMFFERLVAADGNDRVEDLEETLAEVLRTALGEPLKLIGSGILKSGQLLDYTAWARKYCKADSMSAAIANKFEVVRCSSCSPCSPRCWSGRTTSRATRSAFFGSGATRQNCRTRRWRPSTSASAVRPQVHGKGCRLQLGCHHHRGHRAGEPHGFVDWQP